MLGPLPSRLIKNMDVWLGSEVGCVKETIFINARHMLRGDVRNCQKFLTCRAWTVALTTRLGLAGPDMVSPSALGAS